MNSSELGEILKARRKELGLDQKSLAELARVSVHTLSDIESGKANPTLESLTKILEVLGLEIQIRARTIEAM